LTSGIQIVPYARRREVAVVFRYLKDLPQGKRRKHGNIKVTVDGIKFDSKKEARRYQELLMKEKAGLISHLKLKPKFKIMVLDQFLCNYTADFSYWERLELVVEDTKGKDPKTGWDTGTPTYHLKKRLMRIVFKIEVREV
jgi:hypothetical protein